MHDSTNGAAVLETGAEEQGAAVGTETTGASLETITANRLAHFANGDGDGDQKSKAQRRAERRAARVDALASTIGAAVQAETTETDKLAIVAPVEWETERKAIDTALADGKLTIGDLAERFAKMESRAESLNALRYGRLCYLAIVQVTSAPECNGMPKAQLEKRVEVSIFTNVLNRILPYVDFRTSTDTTKRLQTLHQRVPEWLRAAALADAIPSAAHLGARAMRACSSTYLCVQDGQLYKVNPEWTEFLSTFIPQCLETGATADEISAGLTSQYLERKRLTDLANVQAHKLDLESKLANAVTDAHKAELTDAIRKADEVQSTLTGETAAPTAASAGAAVVAGANVQAETPKPVKVTEKQFRECLRRVATLPECAKAAGDEVWTETAAHALVCAMAYDKRNGAAVKMIARSLIVGKLVDVAALLQEAQQAPAQAA